MLNYYKKNYICVQALEISKEERDQAVLYKNRAAVHLKMEDYDKTIRDCTNCKYSTVVV